MILTDGVTTFTNLTEDVTAESIINSNVAITIGGLPKTQADSQRLKITSNIRVTQDEYTTLNTIISNFGQALTYTPSRRLAYKSSITALDVILTGSPEIKQRAWNGEVVFYITLEFEEVPS